MSFSFWGFLIKRTGRLALIAFLQMSLLLPFSPAQDSSLQAGDQSIEDTSAQTVALPAQASAVIPAGQKFILQLQDDLHTRITHKGDRVAFKTAAEIIFENQPVIASGTTIRGTVTKSKRAGRLFGDAEINLKLDELLLPNGTPLPLRATIIRVGFDPIDQNKGGDSEIKGESGTGADAGTIVKAGAQGAIIGVLSAGPKGALYGSAASAAVAAAGMIFRRGPDIDLPRNTMLEARFDGPLEVPAGLTPREMQASGTGSASSQVAAASTAEPPAEDTSTSEARRPVLKRQPASGTGETPAQPNPEADASGPASESSEASVSSASETSVADVGSIPQEPVLSGAHFSVKVQMVLVDAVVRNNAGRMIDSLTQSDFRVYEDGVLQELRSFSFDEVPLAVALLVDRSGSVSPYITELRRIATRTLQQLKPVDQVALFSFAGSVDRIEDLTTDRQRIADSIAGIQAGGGTNINDALYEAAEYLGKAAPDRRHAIIMVSDNQATVDSLASEGEVIMESMETDTVVYSIKTQGKSDLLTIDLPSLIIGAEGVSRIARETGGEVLKASNISSLDSVLGSVISRLRKRYLLGYYPSNTSPGGAFHAISVRLDDRLGQPGKDYFVHARQGYYSTSGRLQ